MADRPVLPVAPAQCDMLRHALADAVFYRDPPLYCQACDQLDALCADCAAGLARARAYLDLGRELGLEPSL